MNIEKRGKYEIEKIKITAKVSEIMDISAKKAFDEIDLASVEFMKKLYTGRRNRAIRGGRLRDAIVYISLKICGINKINKDHLSVIASGEFYNMASYYQNWHLDNKKEIKTEDDKKLCHIASHYFREISESLILSTKFNEKIKLELLKEISESNRAIQIGQSFELNSLNINMLKQINDKNIKELYLKRCFLFSGRFYGCSFAMGPIMAEKDEKTISIFQKIGEFFGTGGQIINDVGDFCLSKNIAKNPEKDYQDQFADLEKGTITMPVYELSKFENIKKYVHRKINWKEKEKLLNIMIKNRCFDSSRKATNELRNKILSLISGMKQSKNTDKLRLIAKTFFNANKFYVNLREEHGNNWRN
jgi:hypothetical protein